MPVRCRLVNLDCGRSFVFSCAVGADGTESQVIDHLNGELHDIATSELDYNAPDSPVFRSHLQFLGDWGFRISQVQRGGGDKVAAWGVTAVS